MKEIEKKAAALLERCETVILSSITEGGAPRPCAVSKLKVQGFRTIFAATGLSGRKTAQFQKNPLAGACFFGDGDSVTMTGSVTVHTSGKILRDCWQDWMKEHFEQGENDPDYCVLQFTAEEATFWIDGEFCTVRYPKAESRCGICCSEMDCKKSFGFDCSGCVRESDAPWGHCEIKACCEEKGYLHCGECGEFPCAALQKFAFDPEQGDQGKRLEICRCWQKEAELC